MILKEEMKARSGSYDNDPWGSARNSRSGSKETLNTTGYSTTAYNNTVNGCKDPPCPPCVSPHLSLVLSVSASLRTYDCISVPETVQPCLCPFHCVCICRHKGFLWALISTVIKVCGEGSEVVDAGQGGSWLLQGRGEVYWDGKMLRGDSSCCQTCHRLSAAAHVSCHCLITLIWMFQATECLSRCADVWDVIKQQ